MKYRECSYYNYGAVCRAGVRVDAKRDDELRLPCVSVNGVTSTTTCSLLVMPVEAKDGKVGELAQALEAIMAGVCPQCRGAVDGEEVVGLVVHAKPCGHIVSDKRRR